MDPYLTNVLKNCQFPVSLKITGGCLKIPNWKIFAKDDLLTVLGSSSQIHVSASKGQHKELYQEWRPDMYLSSNTSELFHDKHCQDKLYWSIGDIAKDFPRYVKPEFCMVGDNGEASLLYNRFNSDVDIELEEIQSHVTGEGNTLDDVIGRPVGMNSKFSISDIKVGFRACEDMNEYDIEEISNRFGLPRRIQFCGEEMRKHLKSSGRSDTVYAICESVPMLLLYDGVLSNIKRESLSTVEHVVYVPQSDIDLSNIKVGVLPKSTEENLEIVCGFSQNQTQGGLNVLQVICRHHRKPEPECSSYIPCVKGQVYTDMTSPEIPFPKPVPKIPPHTRNKEMKDRYVEMTNLEKSLKESSSLNSSTKQKDKCDKDIKSNFNTPHQKSVKASQTHTSEIQDLFKETTTAKQATPMSVSGTAALDRPIESNSPKTSAKTQTDRPAVQVVSSFARIRTVEELSKKIDLYNLCPGYSRKKSNIQWVSSSEVESQKTKSTYEQTTPCVSGVANIGQDLGKLSVSQLSCFFHAYRIEKLADFCQEELIDGSFLMTMTEDDIKGEPFGLNNFQSKKLTLLKTGWRPVEGNDILSSDVKVESLDVKGLKLFFTKYTLKQLADTCEREQVDGRFFVMLSDNDLKEEPFFCSSLTIKKINRLKQGWRPKEC